MYVRHRHVARIFSFFNPPKPCALRKGLVSAVQMPSEHSILQADCQKLEN